MEIVRPLDRVGLRQQQLRILVAFDDWCREQGMTYYLWGGTLLGSVKFRGYIPWDDDIDIAMPREDYERLSRCTHVLPAGLALLSPYRTPGHFLPYLKLGLERSLLIDRTSLDLHTLINIDIFPLDRVPRGRVGEARRWLTYFLVRLLRTSIYPLETGWRRWVRLLSRALLPGVRTRQGVARLIDRCAHYAGRDDGHLRMAVWARGTPLPRSVLEPPELRHFEGRRHPTPRNPDPLLRLVYGDWQAMPPTAGRRTSHRFEAYLLSEGPAA